jgi:FixJ family two-component response regulator
VTSAVAAVSKPIVFVVDDDVYVRESLEAIVEAAGWQPETFSSAREFISRPSRSVPSCLVADVTLPGLSGLELQAQLVVRANMPIIFTTAHVDVPCRRRKRAPSSF